LRILQLLILIISTISLLGQGQDYVLSGKVLTDGSNEPLVGATIYIKQTGQGTATKQDGSFTIDKISERRITLECSFIGYETKEVTIFFATSEVYRDIILTQESIRTSEVEIIDRSRREGITRLRDVENNAIYASKKNEVVLLDKITINKASNVSRQLYAKVAGLNIWESDGAGVQLGLGGRGLSPNRNSNFNTRQNGYDISADALGYPESYYTPPAEALKRIEVIRGAASLQYGTQFGGMINFVFKEGPKDKKFSLNSRLSAGSFDFLNSFTEVGGSSAKLNYYGFYQYKKSGGWRPNSQLDQHNAFGKMKWSVSDKFDVTLEYTHSQYLAQQPGGLTDAEFENTPEISKRSRNWFSVDWNLAAIITNVSLGDNLKWNNRIFGLLAGREALGNLDNINLLDFGEERDFLDDRFENFGNESRLLYRYNINDLPSTLLVGMRFYRGRTERRQGLGSDGDDPVFEYLNPDNVEGSDFVLPSTNLSLFAENVFNLSPKWSITPGIRYENITTESDGYFRDISRDLAGNIINDVRVDEAKENSRAFVLLGIGASFRPTENLEVYTNISQNYRAINFNDIRVNVGSLVVDENLKDESGFTVDLGFRGSATEAISFDVSAYHISYDDRIGTILRREPNPVFNNLVDRVVRFRSNIADARIFGIESLIDINLLKLLDKDKAGRTLNFYTNFAWTTATYESLDNTIDGNDVELVPDITFRTGVNFGWKKLEGSIQYSLTGSHFSDASNAIRTPTAIEGIIPSYSVMDLSLGYTFPRFTIEGGVNNALDQIYFTRRATGYPGPGIIPSDRRGFYLTIGIQI